MPKGPISRRSRPLHSYLVWCCSWPHKMSNCSHWLEETADKCSWTVCCHWHMWHGLGKRWFQGHNWQWLWSNTRRERGRERERERERGGGREGEREGEIVGGGGTDRWGFGWVDKKQWSWFAGAGESVYYIAENFRQEFNFVTFVKAIFWLN